MDVSYIILACHPDRGMKSYGSKSLMVFNKRKLLEYQLSWIDSIRPQKSEIIIISNFDTPKLTKIFPDTNIVELNNNNPIYLGCSIACGKRIQFIDYGCLFNPKILSITQNSSILSINNQPRSNLEVGCVVNDKMVDHMFLDLPDHRFCNIFLINGSDKNKILTDPLFKKGNLLYFEIINSLIATGSKINNITINTKDFIYFNNIRQKVGVNNFVKKQYN